MFDVTLFNNLLLSCCELGFAPVANCNGEEQYFITNLLPSAKTIIVLGHHVQQSLEWAWFPFQSERNGTTCAADLHAKNVIEKVAAVLAENGYAGAIIPYPGQCGVRFKDLAVHTRMGQLGDSFLFLHPSWGPWTHLRVLVTEAEIPARHEPFVEDICSHCGLCLALCPGQAIGEGSFNGLACDAAQTEELNRRIIAGHLYKCEICARCCPVGVPPAEVKFG